MNDIGFQPSFFEILFEMVFEGEAAFRTGFWGSDFAAGIPAIR
ncbi:hypothetical protein [Anaerotignum lactatifermentans]|nr:hypothetical protein [Anaerotignum lactatifermentans]